MTAKELEAQVGFGNCTSIYIGEFLVVAYVDYNVNGGEKLFIHLHNDTAFWQEIDGLKQYTTTESLEKDVRKQYKQLGKRILKSLEVKDDS